MWRFSYYTLVGKVLEVQVSVNFSKMCWTPEHLKTDKYKIRSTLFFHNGKMLRYEKQKLSAFFSANDMTIIGSSKSLRQEKADMCGSVKLEKSIHWTRQQNHEGSLMWSQFEEHETD